MFAQVFGRRLPEHFGPRCECRAKGEKHDCLPVVFLRPWRRGGEAGVRQVQQRQGSGRAIARWVAGCFPCFGVA